MASVPTDMVCLHVIHHRSLDAKVARALRKAAIGPRCRRPRALAHGSTADVHAAVENPGLIRTILAGGDGHLQQFQRPLLEGLVLVADHDTTAVARGFLDRQGP